MFQHSQNSLHAAKWQELQTPRLTWGEINALAAQGEKDLSHWIPAMLDPRLMASFNAAPATPTVPASMHPNAAATQPASAAGAPQQQQVQAIQTPVVAASSVLGKTTIPATATESAVTSVVTSKPAGSPRKIHKTPMPSKTKPQTSTAEKRPFTEPAVAAKVTALPHVAGVAVNRDLVFCKFLSKGTVPQAFPAAAALANLTSSVALGRKVGSQLNCRCLTSPRSPAPTIKLCFDPWAPLELLLQTKSNLLHWGKSCATAKAGDDGRSITEFGDPLPKGTEFLAAYVNGRSRLPEQWSVGAPLHHWIESNIDPTHVYLQRIPIGQSGADVALFAVHMLRESLSQLLRAVFVQQKGASADERYFLSTNLQDLAKTAAAKATDAAVAGSGGWNVGGGGGHHKPSRTTYLVGIDGLPSGVKHPEYLQDVVLTLLQQSASYLRARGIAHVEASTTSKSHPLIPSLQLETSRHVDCADLAVHIRHALIHAASFCLRPDVIDPMPVAIPESIVNPQHQGWILALSPGLPLPCIMLGSALLSCLWGCVPPARRIPPSQPSAASASYKWQMATSEWFDFAMRAAKHASGHHSFRLEDTLSTLIGQKTDPLAFVIRFFPNSWVDMNGDTVIGESKAVQHIVACAARATPMALTMDKVTLDVAPEVDTIDAAVRSGLSSGPGAEDRAVRSMSRQAMGVRLNEGAVRQCEEAVPTVASCPSVLRDQQFGRAGSGAVPGVHATLSLGIGCMSMSREQSGGLVRVTGGGSWAKGWLEPSQVAQMNAAERS